MIVVDGGSSDQTVTIARTAGLRVIETLPGRGHQLGAGAAEATGRWLLFLHADTILDPLWPEPVGAYCAQNGNESRGACFRFALDDQGASARRLERMVAWRTRVLGLPYGDQGLLISKAFYDAVGGYRALELMEDVDLVRRIGRKRIDTLDLAAMTSAARYRRSGYLWRSGRNLFCLGLYFLGMPPRVIAGIYR